MTDGGIARTKRIRARSFKNPPQPHMCIRDTLMGSSDPCYVNVLSWEKAAFVKVAARDIPLYGGMKIHPPRTEKEEVSVFAVMAHPNLLRQHGKKTHSPQGRTWLIDVLLDFVEKMNSGVVFSRRYRVLHDRDITGELKEIWMAVRMDRTMFHPESSCEDLEDPASSYEEQQQQISHQQLQQQQLQQQQEQQSQIQQEQQQQRQEHPQEQHSAQPPQFHPNLHYARDQDTNRERRSGRPCYRSSSLEGTRRCAKDGLLQTANKDPQSPWRNDDYASREPDAPLTFQGQQHPRQQQTFPDGENTPQPPQYHSDVHFDNDYRNVDAERRRAQLLNAPQPTNRSKEGLYPMADKYPSIPSGNEHCVFHDSSQASTPPIQQQSCLPYRPHQYQPLPRPSGQPFPLNVPRNSSTSNPSLFAPSMNIVNHVRPESPISCNKFSPNMEITETINRKPLQPHQHHQVQPSQAAHVQLLHSSTGSYYDPQHPSFPNVVMLRPEESENARRQQAPTSHVTRTRIVSNVVSLLQPHFANAPTTPNRQNASNLASVASKQRETSTKQSSNASLTKISAERANDRSLARNVRSSDEGSGKRCETIHQRTGMEATGERSSVDARNMEKGCKIVVLKREKSLDNDKKVARRDTKISANGETGSVARNEDERGKNRIPEDGGNVEDRLASSSFEKNGHVDDEAGSDKPGGSTTIAKNIVKVFAGERNNSEEFSGKKISNERIVTSECVKESSDRVSKVYTILRKPETAPSQVHVASEMSQLSINGSSRVDKSTNKSGDKNGGRLKRRR